jgi:uncharacterized membrane protein
MAKQSSRSGSKSSSQSSRSGSKSSSRGQSALAAAGKANPAKAGTALSDPKGLAAAGVTIAALPLVVGGVSRLLAPKVSRLGDKASELGDQAKEKATAQVKEKADELTPEMPKKLFGGGGLFGGVFGNGDRDEGAGQGSAAPGHGSGRRMPIQQSVDVAVPIKTAYNQWTRFEDWPEFMHRLESAEQIDDATVAFQAKVWGIKKRFEAEILEQRPDERIEWDVTQGYAHTGVATFHELGDRLTRIEVTLDVEPDNLVDKASRGMRFVKRAVRGDLHRFKAHVELNDSTERGWRGTIEDGKVKRRTDRSSPRSSRSRSSRGSSSSNGSSSQRRSSSSSSGSAKKG